MESIKTTERFFKYILNFAGAAAFALLAFGCANPVTFEGMGNVGGTTGAPKNPADVEMFITQKPAYKYVEMGTLSYNAGSVGSETTGVYQKFREKAAEIGADAVIMTTSTNTFTTAGATTYDSWGNPITFETPVSQTIFRGVAIKRAQ